MDQAVYNISRSLEKITEQQEKISSGKNINRPSDDPAGMAKVMNYRANLLALDQFERNIRSAKSWMSLSETALEHANQVIIRAREIALSQSNATATGETRRIALREVESLIDQLLQIANTQLGERFIFGGFKTDHAPFDSSGAYQGDEGEIQSEISKNDYITINLSGDNAFSDSFDALFQLKEALGVNDPQKISNSLTALVEGSEQIIREQAFLGAKVNRLEAMENVLSLTRLNLTELLSDTEDTDIIKAMTDMNSHQLAYEAMLASTARIIQPTLLNFLK